MIHTESNPRKSLWRESELQYFLQLLEKQGCIINDMPDGGITILQDWTRNRGTIMFVAVPEAIMNFKDKPNSYGAMIDQEMVYKIKWSAFFDEAMKKNTEKGMH